MENKEMAKKMRAAGLKVSICMGLVMSFSLALVGNLTSGHFTLRGFIISFIVSLIISIIIGILVPMPKLNLSIQKKLGGDPRSLKVRLVETCVSDLIYTPIITLAMVALAYFMAMKQSNGMAQLSFVPMFLSSLVICFIVGYVLIFVFVPIFIKIFIPNNARPAPGNERPKK